MTNDLSLADRFWGTPSNPSIDYTGSSIGCWVYLLNRKRGEHDYGRFGAKIDGQQRQWYAHRIAWLLAKGPIPTGLFVLHKCDNPPCVNPAHLFLGTKADNWRDAIAKGRVDPRRPGEGHWHKLTWKQVREIRARHKRGSRKTQSTKALAEEYGVSPSTIRPIVTHKAWNEVATA